MSALRRVCGAEAELPADLITQAMVVHGPGARWVSVQRDLRCIVQVHRGAHHAVVISATGDHAVWATWADDREQDVLLVRRLDCPHEHDRGCSLYDGHGGGHSPDLYDLLLDDPNGEIQAEVDRLMGRTTAEVRPIR